MSRFHGVTVTLVDKGPRSFTTPSSSIVGLVDVYTPGAGLAEPDTPILLTSYKEAVAAFGVNSALTRSARAVFSKSTPVVVAVGVAANADAAALMSAVIGGVKADGRRTGLQALLDAKSVHNVQPRLLLAPGHSRQKAVASAMDALAGRLRAIAIIDGPNTTDEAAIAYAAEFGSKRLYMVDPAVRMWDTVSSAEVVVPGSAYAASMFAYMDKQAGYWASPSNQEMTDLIGTTRPIEFLDGDESCRANQLNNANIATITRDGGFRLWGSRTLSADPKWTFVTRVRTLDMVMDALMAGHKWAVDMGVTSTYVHSVTEGVRAFMRDERAKGALINFDVYADPELNSPSQMELGKVYWNIRFTDVPVAENPTFMVEVTNEWLREVIA